MTDTAGLVGAINSNHLYDSTEIINNYFNNISEDDFSLFDNQISSLYYDTTSLIEKYRNSNVPIILSINIRSLSQNHLDLVQLLNSLNNNNVLVHAIAIQETWNVKFNDLVAIPGYQKMYLKLRTFSNGGGVGIYVKDGISSKQIDIDNSFHERIFESITIELSSGNNKSYISSIYRSPTAIKNMSSTEQFDSFISKLDNHLATLNNMGHVSRIFMDSNIDLSKLHTNQQSNNLADIILSNGFIQILTKSTRIQGPSHSLIDQIITNDISTLPNSGILLNDISDHFVTFTELTTKYKTEKPKPEKKRAFTSQNIENFKNCLRSLSWINVTSDTDVNSSFDVFWNDFNMLYNINFPFQNFKFNKNLHNKQGFMTLGLLTSRTKKNELHKISINNPSPNNINLYKNYRNLYNKTLRASKQLYYENSLTKCQKNPKRTWELLKEISTGKRHASKIEKIVTDNKSLSNDSEIAEEFNTFFTSIGKKISNSIPPTVRSAESYLTRNVNLPNIELNPIQPSQIVDIVKLMESKSSLDSDGLSTKLIKNIIYEISTPLAHIFSLSIRQGIFPHHLKTARVVPIFKSGNNESTDNYRPISLLSIISKILEKTVAIQLVNHLDRNNLLYKHQYGFQKNKNTEHNLLSATNFIHNSLNNGEYCIGLFLDLKKAFDVCSHEILITKLSYLGINDTALNWFKSYLNNRTQFVEINGKRSNLLPLDMSVLQGSILGPILFLCYINDLSNVTNLFMLMFADDTSAFKSGKNLLELTEQMNIEINKMAVWFRANKMSVNVEKTKFIIFRNHGKKITHGEAILKFDANEPDSPYDVDKVYNLERIYNDHPDKNKQTYKLLGIYLDEFLNFNAHTNILCNKLSKSLYCINRAKNFLNIKNLKILYYALIHSHLNYCSIILNSTTQQNKNRILKLQKKAIRIVTKSKFNDHTQPLFNEHRILTYDKIVYLNSAMFMHSIVFKYAPSSFDNVWERTEDRETGYELRQNNTFIVPRPRTEFFKKSPIYQLSELWNNMNENKYQSNRFTFKCAMKNHLYGVWDANHQDLP